RGRRKSSHIGSWRSSPSRGRRWIIGSSDRRRLLEPPRRGPLRALCPSSSLHRLFYQFPTAQEGSLVYVMPVDKQNLGRPTAIRGRAGNAASASQGRVCDSTALNHSKNMFDIMTITPALLQAIVARRRL